MTLRFPYLIFAASLVISLPGKAAIVDIFMTAGQSNAGSTNQFVFGNSVEKAIKESGKYSNPIVIKASHGGAAISQWWYKGEAKRWYLEDFFNPSETEDGKLEAAIKAVIANGDTPVFRGLFWWQGESSKGGVDADFEKNVNPTNTQISFEQVIKQLDTDLGSTSWNYLLNMVLDRPSNVNKVIESIASENPRAIVFDNQSMPHRTKPNDLHGYDHALVGKDNVAAFIEAFGE
jgi:hypothetical protein